MNNENGIEREIKKRYQTDRLAAEIDYNRRVNEMDKRYQDELTDALREVARIESGETIRPLKYVEAIRQEMARALRYLGVERYAEWCQRFGLAALPPTPENDNL